MDGLHQVVYLKRHAASRRIYIFPGPSIMHRMRLTRILFTLTGLFAAANAVHAQTIDRAPKGEADWIREPIAVFLVICVAVASFMNSKRGHQD